MVHRYQQELKENLLRLDQNEDGSQFNLEFMGKVLSAASALNITEFDSWELPPRGRVYEVYDEFSYQVQRYVMTVQIRQTRAHKVYSVCLSDAEKDRIHALVNEIASVIQKSDLEERKRNSLFAKLNLFIADVDRSRTRFDNAMLFMLEGAALAQEYGKALNPLNELFKRIGDVMGKAKSAEPDQAQLPPPEVPKKLEAPQKKIEGPKGGFSRDMDDDIPF
ncbi:hypothetical protein [Rhizobium sp. AU243]|uniref:hypothetical protein n=1 Tax=Rhizobium sp. AU243 TaxID=2303425 RepID=UPI0010CB6C4F|nr:hypothetical protein [Rhizobium sp. AU243]TKV74723.1 hypothetical protein D0C28_02215 [Rhizobium sp. AU243]